MKQVNAGGYDSSASSCESSDELGDVVSERGELNQEEGADWEAKEPVSVIEAFRFARFDPHLWRNVAVGCVWLFILFVGWVALLGWAAEIRRRLAWGHLNPIPRLAFTDFGQYLGTGVVPTCIRIGLGVLVFFWGLVFHLGRDLIVDAVGTVLNGWALFLDVWHALIYRTNVEHSAWTLIEYIWDAQWEFWDIIADGGTTTMLDQFCSNLIESYAYAVLATPLLIFVELKNGVKDTVTPIRASSFIRHTFGVTIVSLVGLFMIEYLLRFLCSMVFFPLLYVTPADFRPAAAEIAMTPASVVVLIMATHLRSQLYRRYLAGGGSPIDIAAPLKLRSELVS